MRRANLHRLAVFLTSFACLLVNSTPVCGQDESSPSFTTGESGLPYIRNFSPKEYQENPQNWCALQDADGVMYFGNGHGILVYDGVSWELIKTPRESGVRSLCLSSGRIYVGATGDLGFLAPNASAQWNFVSLLDSIAETDRDFERERGLQTIVFTCWCLTRAGRCWSPASPRACLSTMAPLFADSRPRPGLS